MNNAASFSGVYTTGADAPAFLGHVPEPLMDAPLSISTPLAGELPPCDDLSTGAVNPDAQAAIDELSDHIERLAVSIDAPKLLKQLFCQTLDWEYVNQPVPTTALPEAARGDVVEATILAKCDQIPLCYVRIGKSDLSISDQRKPLDRLARAWPTVLVAFSNFGQTEIDFCYKMLDGKVARISLDRSLFGAGELAQALYAMRAYDAKTQEPAAQIEVAERLERQLKRMPRRLRQRRGLDDGPFWREIGRHKLLTRDEETRLRRQFTAGQCHSARDKLVLANLRLVVSIAYRYRQRGLAWDDLLQEGVCGLLRAADKYDPERGIKFSTYATWWIWQSLGRAVAEHPPIVRTPIYWSERISQLKHFWRDFIQDHGFAPSDRDVRDYFDLNDDQLCVLRMVRSAWTCQQGVSEGFQCQRSTLPDELVSVRERNQKIRRILNKRLDKRSASIICRRFGLGDTHEETLEEIGQSLSLTRERVRQLEAKALIVLRHPKQSKLLEPYVHP
jgi:RNA polymerase primary sigma factor